jgi:DNA polymerase-1
VPTERLMLLDGYGLVYRGYFALPPLTTSKGELVNGVFGFASIVLRGIQDLQPDYRPSGTSSTPTTRRPG